VFYKLVKKKALHLASLWYLNLQHTKYWYYRLRREEKVIVQALLRLRKLEMKRKLKKLAKQWKIENNDIIEVDYIKDQIKDKQDKDEFKLPKHYKNLDEFFFFGEDLEFMKHYKRTCSNLNIVMNNFFKRGKQAISKTVAQNHEIAITTVKMNKGMTVVYAWWDLPFIIDQESDKDEVTAIKNKIEIRLHSCIPALRSYLTRELGFKYAPQIKFFRETFTKEVIEFENYLEQAKKDLDKSINKDCTYLSESEVIYFKSIPFNRNELISQFAEYNNESLINVLQTTTATNLLEFLQEVFKEKEILTYLNHFKTANNLTDQAIEGFAKQQKEKEKEDESKVNKNTKLYRKQQRLKEKMYKKMRITEQEFNDLKNKKVDFNQAHINFYKNYDKPVPKHGNISQLPFNQEGKVDKYEIRNNIKEESIKGLVRHQLQADERAVKDRRRSKAENFWKNLENMY
jgi:hypothetical protein